MKFFLRRRAPFLAALLVFAAGAAPARAGRLNLPPEAKQGLETLYSGDTDAAIGIFQGMEKSRPDDPLGYVLEAEARWWKISCVSLGIKWGIIDAWKRARTPDDDEYLATADKAIQLSKKRIAQSDSAEMELYAGIAWSLKAQLYSLYQERRAIGKAGVTAREYFLKAKQLDPNLADADFGLGLYNYYVDTLSAFVKMLRFFMGVPGGSKKEGIRQLERAMREGELTPVAARFYLANNRRKYEQQYEQAAALVEPLAGRYPRNPFFLLVLGNLNAELHRGEKAARYFHAAEQLSLHDPACTARVRAIAQTSLNSLSSP